MANFETYEVKVYDNGDKSWYQNGKCHRIDGPAIEYADGDKSWYQNGKCHRIDGPAAEYADGDKFWYQNGKRHRIDGPAIERANGDKCWYIDDKYYSEHDYNAEITKRNANTCEDRLVEIDGIKYKLIKAC
jgi:hypothetical protein